MTHARRPRAATAALLVAAVAALIAIGVVTRSSAPPVAAGANLALVDPDATTEVIEAVNAGLAEILVYDYRRPHRAERAADSFLTGDASQQYHRVYDALAAAGPQQKLIHHSTVTRIGVQRLSRTSAELLVFLEQETVRTTDGSTSQAPAQILVGAVRTDGAWLVDSIELL